MSSRVQCGPKTRRSLLTGALIGAIALLAVLALPSCTFDSSPVKDLSLHAPRSFGYVIGDRIHHRISMTLARPYVLEKDFLPKAGPLNAWLELTDIHWRETNALTQRHYELFLTYQIFKGVKAPETLTIPAVAMRVRDGDNSINVSTPAWSFSLTPLIPSHTKDEAVRIRPALATPRLSLQRHLWLLGAMASGVILILLYCAWCYDLLPFLHRHPGPFTRACRRLKNLRSRSDTDCYRVALRIVHQALNEMAGETVFVNQLGRLYERHPNLAGLRGDTEAFFAVSRQVFFGQAVDRLQQDYPLHWLEQLCQQYRKKENSLR